MSSPTSDQVRAELRTIVGELAGVQGFGDGDDLFTTGAISSMNVLELIVAIEDRFAIEVLQRDVFDGRLRTLDDLVTFVTGRTPA